MAALEATLLSPEEKALHKHLVRSQQALQILRNRIKLWWLALAVVPGLGILVYIQYGYGFRKFEGCWHLCLVACAASPVRLILVSLAPLVDDLVFTRIMVLTDLFLELTNSAMEVADSQRSLWGASPGVSLHHQHLPSLASMLVLTSIAIQALSFGGCGLWALLTRSIPEAQRRMWVGLGLFAACEAAREAVRTLHVALSEHRLPAHALCILFPLPLLCIAASPEFRKKAQARCLRWLEGLAATRGAASLACLMGSVPPGEAMSLARQRFRCVPDSQSIREVLADAVPDAELFALSRPCALGSCTAFVSHSWHDDGPAKWRALQTWSAAFAKSCGAGAGAGAGTQPTFWFDKLCIDQKNIDLDLRCLPIFLKGCGRLVVLCGPTYLSRLWCVLEIFTHVHMGGRSEDIDVVQVLREGFELEDAEAIEASFDNFDARDCRCFDEGDKRRMLAIIEAAFGNLDAFNSNVRGIAGQVRTKLSIRSELVPMATRRILKEDFLEV